MATRGQPPPPPPKKRTLAALIAGRRDPGTAVSANPNLEPRPSKSCKISPSPPTIENGADASTTPWVDEDSDSVSDSGTSDSSSDVGESDVGEIEFVPPRKNTEIDEAAPESTTLTGVGIITKSKKGFSAVTDEAFWDQPPTISTPRYALLVYWDLRRKLLQTLTVQSQFLVSVIMKVLPRTDFMGVRKQHASLSIDQPFSALYWFYDKIVDAASQPDTRNRNDARDLEILRRWYETNLLSEHVNIRNTIDSGYVTFDVLWALFRPNDTAYTLDDFQQPRLCLVSSTLYDPDSYRSRGYTNAPAYNGPPPRFRIILLHQDWDASLQVFKIMSEDFFIYFYTGSRRITDLSVYPLRYHHAGRQDLLRSLEARGRRWKSLVTQPSYMVHKGPAIQLDGNISATRKHLDERLIIDHSGYALYREQPDPMSNNIPPHMRQPPPIPPMMSRPSISVEGIEDLRDEQGPSEDFSALQAQLCPTTVRACSPLTMKWFTVNIGNLTEMVWAKDSAKALVMADPNTKDTLVKLIQAHRSASEGNAPSDVISGKGQGLIIVLHGPPGVGKTLTAESMAEVSERPLVTVDVGQLAFERSVDSHLRRIFEQAVRWNAVLLLDEADVVLEKRSWENHARNAIVSIFLRMLEYYRGIVFLTTNRLGTIDTAFQSRVSLGIKYGPLLTEQREQIWRNLLERLGPSEIEARQEIAAHLDVMKTWELNGRQIRNILRMAQSIAFTEQGIRGTMRFRHIERMVAQTLHFEEYFEEGRKEARSQLRGVDKAFRESRVAQGQLSTNGRVSSSYGHLLG